MDIYAQYASLRELNKNIRNAKRRLINGICKNVRPYMWTAGYDKDIVVFPMGKYYKPNGLSKSLFPVSGEYDGICGFMDGGFIITDGHCGALSVNHLSSLCIEDLINLWAWVERNEGKFKAAKDHYCPKKQAA